MVEVCRPQQLRTPQIAFHLSRLGHGSLWPCFHTSRPRLCSFRRDNILPGSKPHLQLAHSSPLAMALNSASANSTQSDAPGSVPNDGTGIVQLDGYLEPFSGALKSRFSKAQQWIKTIDETEGGLEKFSRVRIAQLALMHAADIAPRVMRSLASTSSPMATSSTANGPRTPCAPTSSATSTTGTAMRRQ